jgi:membrane protein DedA with SNARE-associated domain
MLDWLTTVISSLGYLGIVLLMLLENFVPFVPEELIMPLAGFTVQRGDLSFPWVVLAGAIGTVLGALLWYALGRRVGEKRMSHWVDNHGKWLGLTGDDIDKSKRWFDRHGGMVVFFGRLVPGIRTYISIPAGFEEMPLLPFLLFSSVGTLLWVTGLTYAGYVLGQNYQAVETFFGPVSTIALLGSAVAVGVWLSRRKQQRKQSGTRR